MLAGLAVVLWVGLTTPAFLGIITRADLTVLRAVATLRSDPLTRIMLDIDAVRSMWTVRVLALGTIAALIALRRFRHLAAYLVVFLAAELLVSTMAPAIGRMRPAGIAILGHWAATPSRQCPSRRWP